MKIRKAKPSDLDALTALEAACFPEAEADKREYFEARIKTHPQTIWLLFEDGELVSAINGMTTDEMEFKDSMLGSTEAYKKKGKWLMLFGVATRPDMQHKGYATKLMKAVMDECRGAVKGIILTTKREKQSFYTRFGFALQGESSSRLGGAKWYQMRLDSKDIKINWLAEFKEIIILVALAAVTAFILGKFVLLNCDIPSGSMMNTIQVGDRVIGSRLTYKLTNPKRGDIAIFYWPDDENQIYIKRIIGLPGDTVEVKAGEVYVNGTALKEDYLIEGAELDTRDAGPYEVPADSYFMMGDNRPNSADSRFWENTYVKKEKILAKASFIYYPLKDIDWLAGGADY